MGQPKYDQMKINDDIGTLERKWRALYKFEATSEVNMPKEHIVAVCCRNAYLVVGRMLYFFLFFFNTTNYTTEVDHDLELAWKAVDQASLVQAIKTVIWRTFSLGNYNY